MRVVDDQDSMDLQGTHRGMGLFALHVNVDNLDSTMFVFVPNHFVSQLLDGLFHISCVYPAFFKCRLRKSTGAQNQRSRNTVQCFPIVVCSASERLMQMTHIGFARSTIKECARIFARSAFECLPGWPAGLGCAGLAGTGQPSLKTLL